MAGFCFGSSRSGRSGWSGRVSFWVRPAGLVGLVGFTTKSLNSYILAAKAQDGYRIFKFLQGSGSTRPKTRQGQPPKSGNQRSGRVYSAGLFGCDGFSPENLKIFSNRPTKAQDRPKILRFLGTVPHPFAETTRTQPQNPARVLVPGRYRTRVVEQMCDSEGRGSKGEA